MDNTLAKEEQRLLRAMGKKREAKVVSPSQPTESTTKSNLSGHSRIPSNQSRHTRIPTDNSKKTNDSVTVNPSSSTINEEEIKRRELQYEKEREMLKRVEEDLMRNRKSALDGFDVDLELDLVTKNTKNSTQHIKTESKEEPQVQQNDNNNSSGNWNNSNKSLSDDVDDLLNKLNSANIGRTKAQIDLDSAKSIISKRRAEIFSVLSMAMASDPPSNPEEKLREYMVGIIEAVKPVSEKSKEISLIDFSYVPFAKNVDVLIHSIAKGLHCIVDPSSQESIISHCADLLDKEVDLFNTIYNDILIGGEDKDQKVLSILNKFNLLLKRLMETLSNVSKHQILDYQYSKDKQATLAQYIQETAVFAKNIGEILKQPLFEPQTFKDNLTSMIESIKKIIEILPDEKKETLMNMTKVILEKSLQLQDSHTKPDIPNEVLNSISDVLKFLISNLDTSSP